MEGVHVAAALLSALLHAGWHAAVKASARPTEAMAAQMLVCLRVSSRSASPLIAISAAHLGVQDTKLK